MKFYLLQRTRDYAHPWNESSVWNLPAKKTLQPLNETMARFS
jgi:hypothetical protein